MSLIDFKKAKEFSAREPRTDAEKLRLVTAFLFALGPSIGRDFSEGEVTEDLLRIADRLEALDGAEPDEGDLVDSNEVLSDDIRNFRD